MENKKNKTNAQKEQSDKKPSAQNPFGNQPKKRKVSFYWIYILLAAILIGMQFYPNNQNSPKKTTWKELKGLLQEQKVKKIIVVNQEEAEVFTEIKEDQKDSKGFFGNNTIPQYLYTIGPADKFEELVTDAQIDVPEDQKVFIEWDTRSNWGSQIMSWIFPILLLVVFWIFIMRSMSKGSGGGGGIFSVGRSKAQLFDKNSSSVSVNFNDVAGLDEAKIEIMEIVDFLKNPKKYTSLGGKIPKGALLVGPPGTGKTLLAKAVAGEAKVPFFSLSGSDFVEMFVGVGASRVRDLFRQAKEKAPCIIFIDEIDAIGRSRGKNQITGGNDERENTLNQLLTEMDGFAGNVGVIILAATNRAEILDPALMRAGRFDRQIYLDLPDLDERRAIFEVHLKPLKVNDKEVNSESLAKQTPGFSGADIANVCNEAALIAARKSKKSIDKQDFLDSIDRIVGGLEKKTKIITSDEKRTIAFHEAGHASVSWMLPYAHPLVKVTIVPRGKSLGAAWYLPDERQITTKEQLLDEMTATLGGRASEEINFGQISTGALNDLERVTKQAYSMVAFYGLNEKIGNRSYYDSSGQEYSFSKPYGEKTSQIIDEEVSKMIEDSYKVAKKIISENKEKVEELAQRLLDREVIFREDLEDIFGKRQFDHELRAQQEREEIMKKRQDQLKSLKDIKSETETATEKKSEKLIEEVSDSEIASSSTDESTDQNIEKNE
ncbi:MAG: ATP-dependent zinc metalloprotease FtsH [Bacteroidales bacterium]|nr:ATP-dependent zinc metalloprotease FtsH [Bacteroidales bacterium]